MVTSSVFKRSAKSWLLLHDNVNPSFGSAGKYITTTTNTMVSLIIIITMCPVTSQTVGRGWWFSLLVAVPDLID